MRKALGRSSLLTPRQKDFMERSFKKKVARNERIAGGKSASKAVEIRNQRKGSALRAKGKYDDLAEDTLEEGYQAKRLRILRKASKDEHAPFAPGTEKFMKNTYKRKVARDEKISGGRGAVTALAIRRRKKAAAMKAKGLAEDTLNEGILKKLRRAKGAAYAAMQKGEGDKYAKLHGVASGLESRYAAKMASRGGASPEAVKGAGSTIGKSGKPTMKAARLATVRDKGLARFRSTSKFARYRETGGFEGKLSDEAVAKKRAIQRSRAEFANKARSGDFGQNNQAINQAGLRARSNFQKRYGRLKGK